MPHPPLCLFLVDFVIVVATGEFWWVHDTSLVGAVAKNDLSLSHTHISPISSRFYREFSAQREPCAKEVLPVAWSRPPPHLASSNRLPPCQPPSQGVSSRGQSARKYSYTLAEQFIHLFIQIVSQFVCMFVYLVFILLKRYPGGERLRCHMCVEHQRLAV